jgi:hypothetical protein
MKKLLFLFAVVSSFTVSAQIRNEVGIIAGPNWHYQISKDNMYKPGSGFVAGVTNNLYFGKHSFYSALMFERRNIVQEEFFFIDFPPYPSRAKHTEDYITMPLMYRYTFGNKAINAFINAGPQFGFGFNQESQYYYDTQDPIGDPWHYKSNNFELNIAMAFGGGIKANLYKDFSMGLEFRQSFWLASLYKDSNTFVTDSYATPLGTSYLLLTAAYKFGK